MDLFLCVIFLTYREEMFYQYFTYFDFFLICFQLEC